MVAAPLAAGTCNLGEPRAVDFAAQAGNQFVSFAVTENVPAASPWQLALISLVMLAGGVFELRRRGATMA